MRRAIDHVEFTVSSTSVSLWRRKRNLRERHGERPLDAPEQLRMEEIETQLDQCWDLLNQRRALS